MKVLIALLMASTLCLSAQSQVSRPPKSAVEILPLTRVQVENLPLTTRSLSLLGLGAPPSAPYEFRGIRIGDQMKEAKQKFLSWKIPSLPFKPGLCGSDGIYRVETCTDVLETGQYVNMTILDRRVAQIYVSTDSRTGGDSYDRYVLTLAKKYGRPDRVAIRQNRSGFANEFLAEQPRWSRGDQYIKARSDEHSFTIGSESLDMEIEKLEKTQKF